MPIHDALPTIAKRVRRNALASIYYAKSGHPGGCLSVTDILVYLYGKHVDPALLRTGDPDRDRIVLSKGHACPALYAMAAEIGLLPFPSLLTLRQLGSSLQGHPSVRDIPWAETSTGSLGQGFSAAIGMALGLRYKDSPARVYVILGDGELQEGEIWEGAMCAGHYKLDNFCAIVDYNKMQSDDLTENIMGLEPLEAKWQAFNWHTLTIEGHDFVQIESAIKEACSCQGKPVVIIAHTIKGRGISFMEESPLWHGSLTLKAEEFTLALRDLDTPEDEIERYLNGTAW